MTHVGDVAAIVQGGSGKSSLTPPDPGEPHKIKPAQSSDYRLRPSVSPVAPRPARHGRRHAMLELTIREPAGDAGPAPGTVTHVNVHGSFGLLKCLGKTFAR